MKSEIPYHPELIAAIQKVTPFQGTLLADLFDRMKSYDAVLSIATYAIQHAMTLNQAAEIFDRDNLISFDITRFSDDQCPVETCKKHTGIYPTHLSSDQVIIHCPHCITPLHSYLDSGSKFDGAKHTVSYRWRIAEAAPLLNVPPYPTPRNNG